MEVEFSGLELPQAVGLFDAPLPANDGLVWPVGRVDAAGMPHGTGAAPKRGFLVWGEHGGAPADAEWVKATDLGGLKDGGADAFLWACLYDGRLFLHLGAAAPVSTGGVLAESGEGFCAVTDEAGMPHNCGRHGGPAAYVCGMDERDAFLKVTGVDGVTRWRADVSWDVLATVCFTVVATPTPEPILPWSNRALTVWAAVSGNVVCFFTTTADYYMEGELVYSARNWAAFGSVVCQYGYNPRNEFDGVQDGLWQNVLGGVVPVEIGAASELDGFRHVAPLPWQGGGGDVVFEGDGGSEVQGLGTLNCTVVEDTGLPFGNASFQPDPGIFFCPRLHFNNPLFPADSGGGAFTKNGVSAILYGGSGAFEVGNNHFMLSPQGVPGVNLVEVVPGFNLLFSPWGVEGLGLHRRGTLDFARVDARDFLPPYPGAEWVRVAAATLYGPQGFPVYIDIAGAVADGCLLTASGSTEFEAYL